MQVQNRYCDRKMEDKTRFWVPEDLEYEETVNSRSSSSWWGTKTERMTWQSIQVEYWSSIKIKPFMVGYHVQILSVSVTESAVAENKML